VSEKTSEPDEELPEPLETLLACGADEEGAVLDKILADGHNQGWVLCDCDSAVISLSPQQAEILVARAGQRDVVMPSQGDAWADAQPPARPVPDQSSCWAVLTQRCDLVRSFAVEPVVEVARIVKLDAETGAPAARSNSPRLIYLADANDGSVWAVDLRQRAVVPKHALQSITAVPAIDTERAQKRFRLRLGQRYWRDPVPDDLVDTLQRPLIDAVRKSATRIARFENFAMWLGLRADDNQVIVLAVAADGRLDQAREDWDEVMTILTNRSAAAAALIEPNDSGVYAADDISLGLWLDSFKFDFDELTYGRRAGETNAEPPV
jgi:hypothetical protein